MSMSLALLIWSLMLKTLIATDCKQTYQMCKSKTISDYAYCWAYEACREATLKNIAQCYSFDSCNKATISGSQAQCRGLEACQSATITSANTYCYGMNGCNAATITSTNVYCDGFYGCQSAKIKATNVYARSYLSANAADIEPNTGNLAVYLTGLQAGNGADIRCPAGKTCTIDCGTTAGCKTAKAYCFEGSTCTFKCGKDNCPTLYSKETGFPDPDIWRIYYENKEKKKNLPDNEFPLDYNYRDDNDDRFNPTNVIAVNSNMILAFLIGAGFASAIGLCFVNMKKWKDSQKYYENEQ